MTEYILQLSDEKATLDSVGGKGMSLARLARAGLPVPAGFHLTTAAYRKFVSANRQQAQIMDHLTNVNLSQPSSLEKASQHISQLFSSAAMPDEVAEEIKKSYEQLKGVPVAVRSSATAEDLPEASSAGQQDTYLNIQGEEALLAAVKRCWASLWTARAIGYRLKNGIDQERVALAVVVQVLIPAEAAGVMFTANPTNGHRSECVINAAWGLGEAIVSGVVTPDSITVDKTSERLLSREIAAKQVMTVRTETGTSEQPVSPDKISSPVLSDEQVIGLTQIGAQIEVLYGMPMDIEWALAKGKFAILQARPITALPDAQVIPITEWKLSDPKGIYMRASIIEQLPEPLTPLFSTIGGPIIEEGTRRLIGSMVGGKGLKPELRLFETINGYGYMNTNIGVWNTLRMGLSQVFKMNGMFKTSESRWRQARGHYNEVIQHWRSRPLKDYSAVELLEGVRALFGETMALYAVLQVGPIATALASETMFTQLYNRLIKKKGDPDASVFLMGFESMPIRAEQALYDLADWARTSDELRDHLAATPAAQLATELDRNDAPAGLLPEIWQEWQNRFQAHLASYGHFTYDLDFSKAVAADDPAPLLETCRMYLLGKAGNPHARVQALAAQREQAVQATLKRLHGLKRWIFNQQVHSAQRYGPLREDGLSDLGMGYPLLRRMLHELGSRLVGSGSLTRPGDVFWLNQQEVEQGARALDKGSPQSSMKAIVEKRREVWQSEQRVSPPVVLPVGSKYFGMNVEKLTSGGPTADPHTIKGFASSQGKVTATARVLLGPQDFDQMQLGDVLVAPLTTPAWTPLFALASAIVTDIGGPLSHSSIVAREYGIPAVLGTSVATRRIRSGQTITVDGSAGTVMY